MSEKNTVLRSLHDVGLAAWFGGSLMGAVALNGATAAARDPQERTRLSSFGWARWAPVNAASIGAHLVGATGLLVANRRRLGRQPEARVAAVAKTALTATALGVTAYAGRQGAEVARRAEQGADGATEPRAAADRDLTTAQERLRSLQWAIPAITGTLLALGSLQGEQQRPIAQARSLGRRGGLRSA